MYLCKNEQRFGGTGRSEGNSGENDRSIDVEQMVEDGFSFFYDTLDVQEQLESKHHSLQRALHGHRIRNHDHNIRSGAEPQKVSIDRLL